MKKFLAIMSVVIVVAMLMSLPTFAADHEKQYGQEIIKATKLDKAPTIDGKVSADEYGAVSVSKTEPNYWQGKGSEDGSYANVLTDTSAYAHLTHKCMDQLDVWFAYDDNNVYIAYKQLGGSWDSDKDADTTAGNGWDEYTFRHNYVMRMGFNIDDATQLMEFSYSMPKIVDGVGDLGGTVKFTNGGASAQGSAGVLYEGISPIDNAMMYKTYVDGTPLNAINAETGPYIEMVEISLSKVSLLEAFNAVGGTNYEELPTGMFFTFSARQYSWGTEDHKGSNNVCYDGQTEWFAKALDSDQLFDYARNAKYFPAIVVLGDKVEIPVKETEAPTTEAPTEAPTTEAPTTEAPTEAPTTEAPTTEPTEAGGCGASVSAAGIALVAMLGTAATVVSKKRR